MKANLRVLSYLCDGHKDSMKTSDQRHKDSNEGTRER